jgi:hypothetical protein
LRREKLKRNRNDLKDVWLNRNKEEIREKRSMRIVYKTKLPLNKIFNNK